MESDLIAEKANFLNVRVHDNAVQMRLFLEGVPECSVEFNKEQLAELIELLTRQLGELK